ncbi:uncharacterized protein LOC109545208 isoform X3 [Dendroctonus ponderosae]|uniref:uncharacterized protein LOC109545208 isoform X3 n=1 Tax=Dendroctonus ponderosae TaxID=77166 RepID=UPI0020359F66|nr:uncharacterized protein LOC109545208 isoform X3 [Dendroctonus ponderosae]
MRLLHIFVYGTLYFTNLCVQENDVVAVGKYDLQCGDYRNILKAPSKVTKIKLLKNVEALYSVTSEKAVSCVVNSANCTLMTWNIIRGLEIFLNKHFNNTGTSGIIQFGNNMIIPGYNYLLHVIMKTSSGIFVENSFNLTFDANDWLEDKTAFLGNLELTTGCYAIPSTLPIVVNANVTLCGDIPYYYASVDLLLTAPLEIQLPEIFLPFNYTTFNRGAPISIEPYILLPKLMEDYQTQWSCLLEDTLLYVCQAQINEEFYVETGFNQEGNYTITILVAAGNVEVTATCHIIVALDVPSIEFFIPYPLKPDRGIEITARISELRTYCTVQWIGDGDNDLKTILENNIYNISSKDKTFLEEMVELGSITVTRDFKLKFPQPSTTSSGLDSKNYQVTLTVVCPSLQEVSNENIVKEQPTSFVTVHGVTGFFVPPSPNVEVFVILSDQNEALNSEFTFVVELTEENSDDLMLVKYGFVLEGVEVQFYTGINALSSKTILPYNGDFGVETYVEVCGYKNRCSKKLGPLVKTTLSYDYSEKDIYHPFMQKLIEGDYYKAFAYVFMVQYSLGFVNKSDKCNGLFASQLIQKIEDLLVEDDAKGLNGFLKSAVIFMDHIKLSDDLWKKLFSISHDLLSSVKSIHPNRFTRSPDIYRHGTADKLEAIKTSIKMSELLILNLEENVGITKEKIHFLNMVDQWMIEACGMLFDEHPRRRTFKFDIKIAQFLIEKISWQTLRDSIKMPFDEYVWNLTSYMTYLPVDDGLCFGFSKLSDVLFNDTSFGINIYSSRNGDVNLSEHGEIEVHIPYLETSVSQCNVYSKDSNILCDVSKPFPNYMQCICPKFGFFYLDSQRNVTENINHTLINLTDKINESCREYEVKLKKHRKLGGQISYIMIISSIMGVSILCYILRQLTVVLQQNVEIEGHTDYEY